MALVRWKVWIETQKESQHYVKIFNITILSYQTILICKETSFPYLTQNFSWICEFLKNHPTLKKPLPLKKKKQNQTTKKLMHMGFQSKTAKQNKIPVLKLSLSKISSFLPPYPKNGYLLLLKKWGNYRNWTTFAGINSWVQLWI